MLKDLQPAGNYVVQVIAVNEFGESFPSIDMFLAVKLKSKHNNCQICVVLDTCIVMIMTFINKH